MPVPNNRSRIVKYTRNSKTGKRFQKEARRDFQRWAIFKDNVIHKLDEKTSESLVMYGKPPGGGTYIKICHECDARQGVGKHHKGYCSRLNKPLLAPYHPQKVIAKREIPISVSTVFEPKTSETLFEFPSNAHKYSIRISSTELNILKTNDWINDTLVNMWMWKLLIDNSTISSGFHVMSSHFYSGIRDSFNKSSDLTTKLKGYQSFQGWTKDLNIFHKDYLVIPMHCINHWVLGIVKFQYSDTNTNGPRVTMFILNSLVTTNSFKDEVYAVMLFYLSCEWFFGIKQFEEEGQRSKISLQEAINQESSEFNFSFFNSKFEIVVPKVPQQTDTYSCGIYMFMFLDFFLSSKYSRNDVQSITSFFEKLSISPNTVQEYRTRMKEFLENSSSHNPDSLKSDLVGEIGSEKSVLDISIEDILKVSRIDESIMEEENDVQDAQEEEVEGEEKSCNSEDEEMNWHENSLLGEGSEVIKFVRCFIEQLDLSMESWKSMDPLDIQLKYPFPQPCLRPIMSKKKKTITKEKNKGWQEEFILSPAMSLLSNSVLFPLDWEKIARKKGLNDINFHCDVCKKKLSRHGWRGEPKFESTGSLDFSVFLIYRYQCTDCKFPKPNQKTRSYNALSPSILKQLPDILVESFPYVVVGHRILKKSIISQLSELIVNGAASFEAFSKSLTASLVNELCDVNLSRIHETRIRLKNEFRDKNLDNEIQRRCNFEMCDFAKPLTIPTNVLRKGFSQFVTAQQGLIHGYFFRNRRMAQSFGLDHKVSRAKDKTRNGIFGLVVFMNDYGAVMTYKSCATKTNEDLKELLDLIKPDLEKAKCAWSDQPRTDYGLIKRSLNLDTYMDLFHEVQKILRVAYKSHLQFPLFRNLVKLCFYSFGKDSVAKVKLKLESNNIAPLLNKYKAKNIDDLLTKPSFLFSRADILRILKSPQRIKHNLESVFRHFSTTPSLLKKEFPTVLQNVKENIDKYFPKENLAYLDHSILSSGDIRYHRGTNLIEALNKNIEAVDLYRYGNVLGNLVILLVCSRWSLQSENRFKELNMIEGMYDLNRIHKIQLAKKSLQHQLKLNDDDSPFSALCPGFWNIEVAPKNKQFSSFKTSAIGSTVKKACEEYKVDPLSSMMASHYAQPFDDENKPAEFAVFIRFISLVIISNDDNSLSPSSNEKYFSSSPNGERIFSPLFYQDLVENLHEVVDPQYVSLEWNRCICEALVSNLGATEETTVDFYGIEVDLNSVSFKEPLQVTDGLRKYGSRNCLAKNQGAMILSKSLLHIESKPQLFRKISPNEKRPIIKLNTGKIPKKVKVLPHVGENTLSEDQGTTSDTFVSKEQPLRTADTTLIEFQEEIKSKGIKCQWCPVYRHKSNTDCKFYIWKKEQEGLGFQPERGRDQNGNQVNEMEKWRIAYRRFLACDL